MEMMKWQRDNAVPVALAQKARPDEVKGKIVYGELWRCERPEYTREYDAIMQRAGGEQK